MNRVFAKYLINALILIVLQVLVFNQINVKIGNFFITPFVYVLFIMLLPMDTKPEVVLWSAFFVGLVIDLLSWTVALHTASLVLVAYLRTFILNLIAPRMGYGQGTLPSYLFYGWGWFFKYAVLMVVIHDFWYYFLDTFSFSALGLILVKTVLNSLISITFILMLHYIFKNRPQIA